MEPQLIVAALVIPFSISPDFAAARRALRDLPDNDVIQRLAERDLWNVIDDSPEWLAQARQCGKDAVQIVEDGWRGRHPDFAQVHYRGSRFLITGEKTRETLAEGVWAVRIMNALDLAKAAGSESNPEEMEE